MNLTGRLDPYILISREDTITVLEKNFPESKSQMMAGCFWKSLYKSLSLSQIDVTWKMGEEGNPQQVSGGPSELPESFPAEAGERLGGGWAQSCCGESHRAGASALRLGERNLARQAWQGGSEAGGQGSTKSSIEGQSQRS